MEKGKVHMIGARDPVLDAYAKVHKRRVMQTLSA
jgi:hypothetical protein